MKVLCAFLMSMIAIAKGQEPLKTVEDRVAEYGDAVRERLEPRFRAAGVPYPPAQLTLVGLKQERMLEVYAAGADESFKFVCSYPILAASGVPGPKLREGDRQVPEGIYRVRELNPNSSFHLSLWLNYPNEFDLAHAAEEGRRDPGSEIMIHGDARSRGCLAMGDPASEDLFVLAALTGIGNISVILAPTDLRQQLFAVPSGAPAWTGDLYQRIHDELNAYKRGE